MDKIKINLVSGATLEKPLVTAFKGNGGTYIVFDNEMNGTMGLPIILVSKLANNILTKIEDQNEWAAVKESLRLIISGNQVDYVKVEAMLSANDIFFSQLTLPIASFEALKNNYKPNDEVGNNSQVAPTLNEIAQPMGTSNEVQENNINPQVDNANNGMSIEPQIIQPQVEVVPENNVENTNVTMEPNVEPVMPTPPINSQNIAAVEETNIAPENAPNIANTVVSENPINNVPTDFTADKEAFLKACENMFDALVAKFNNKQ